MKGETVLDPFGRARLTTRAWIETYCWPPMLIVFMRRARLTTRAWIETNRKSAPTPRASCRARGLKLVRLGRAAGGWWVARVSRRARGLKLEDEGHQRRRRRRARLTTRAWIETCTGSTNSSKTPVARVSRRARGLKQNDAKAEQCRAQVARVSRRARGLKHLHFRLWAQLLGSRASHDARVD